MFVLQEDNTSATFILLKDLLNAYVRMALNACTRASTLKRAITVASVLFRLEFVCEYHRRVANACLCTRIIESC